MSDFNTLRAATVARPATRRVVLAKVAADKHAPALLRLCVVRKQSETLLILITCGLKLRHEVTHACFEALGRDHNLDASFLPRNEACLLEI